MMKKLDQLFSAQPNRQPKKNGVVMDFKFVKLIISYDFDIIIAASLKDTQRQLCVESDGCKNSKPQS